MYSFVVSNLTDFILISFSGCQVITRNTVQDLKLTAVNLLFGELGSDLMPRDEAWKPSKSARCDETIV